MKGAGAVAALALAAAAAAQTSFVPSRLRDGKTPDFRGIWQVRDTAYVNIEGHPAGKGIAASRSLVVDPPNGRIPYKSEALSRRRENYRTRAAADPSLKCYQAGVPRATYLPAPLQVLQSPGNECAAIRRFQPRWRKATALARASGRTSPPSMRFAKADQE